MPKSFDIRRVSRVVKKESREASAKENPAANYQRKIHKSQPLPDYFREDGPIHKSFANSPKKKKSSFATTFIVLLLLLVGVAAAGFFIFGNTSFGGKLLKLSLNLPEEVVAGEDFTISLAYENLDKVVLGQLEIALEYPENFYFVEASQPPVNVEKNVWKPEQIKAKAKEQITIKGYLVGELNDKKDFRAIIHYQPANFNSPFQESAVKETKIKDSLLKVSLESPSEIDDNTTVQLKVQYQNNSSTDMDNLNVVFDLGDAFTVSERSPSSTAEWLNQSLKTNEGKEAYLKGKIDSTKANPYKYNLSIWRTLAAQQLFLYKKEAEIKIRAPQLLVSLNLADEKQLLNWGNDINYKLQIENKGEYPVNQAALNLVFLSDYLDWDKFKNQDNAKVDQETSSLTFTPESGNWAEKLAEIKPGDKIEATIAISIQNEPTDLVDLSVSELIVDGIASVSFKAGDEYKIFSSEHLIKNITTQLKLIAEARYYLDQTTTVGSGPIPPIIGQQTSYRIYWKIFSGPNSLKNVVVKTTLPAYVEKSVDGGEITIGSPLKYNTATREVVWEINNLAANSLVMASFDVGITPDASQVNQLLILINPTILEAAAGSPRLSVGEAGQKVTKTVGLLTSDLTTDPVANGKGRVTVE